jgi:hypothetical protein
MSANVTVAATPANSTGSSDGLSFDQTASFTFSSGAAPPAHNFLAAVEQSGTNSGQIDFYNIALGGSGAADTFTAFPSAPTLAVTNSTNQGKPDVDNPLTLAWDSSGDLLIANGGTTMSGDYGNLACVPAGSIATGAAVSTTTTADVETPVGIAYDSRNGEVALADNKSGAPEQMSEYALNGDYTLDASNFAIASGYGAFSVAGIPALTAGTFAVALTTGTESDPSHGGTGQSKIEIVNPSAGTTPLSDTTNFTIDEPYGLAWDANNNQLAIANFSSFHKLLSFYTEGGTFVNSVNTSMRNFKVAASANGTIAVAGNAPSGSGYPQVRIYDNTSARDQLTNGLIPFNTIDNATDCSNGVGYIYGDGVTIDALVWLSNTKLLVGLQADTSGSANSYNGFYIFDISATGTATGVDDDSCAAETTAPPKQTGFQHISNKPLAAAFKP